MQDINTLLQSLGIGQPQSANITGVGQDGGLADILASLSDNRQQDNYLSSYDAPQEASVVDFGDMQPMDYGSGGMGGGESYVPENRISNHIQQLLGAQEAPQSSSVMDILSNRFNNSSGPSFGDYSQAIQNSAYGKPTSAQSIADSSAANQIKLMASMGKGSSALQAAQLGGARGGLIAQYMTANPGASFNDALAATSPLLGQGIQMQNGQAAPIGGYGEAKAGFAGQTQNAKNQSNLQFAAPIEAQKKIGAGEITDIQKRERGQNQMGTIVNGMKAEYQKLKEMRAITSQEFDPSENLAISTTMTSNMAQGMRNKMATPDAVVRQNINNMIPRLMTTIKSSTGMSAQEINSIPEMQLLKESVGNPKQPIETVFSTLDDLMALYGPAQNNIQTLQSNGPNLQDPGFLQFLQSKGINVGQ